MNIMITGASSGIGLRIAEKLVTAGHTVFNVSRTACEQPKIVNILVDLSEPQGIVKAFDSATRHCGKLDVGIYCAGYAIAGSIADVDYSDVESLTQVNYLSAVRFTSEFARRFKRGKVILMSSMAAYFPLPFQPHYSASKAALLAFARSAAQEYKFTGLQIACVTPGGTATPFSAHRQKVYGNKENQNLNAAIASITDIEQTGLLADDVAAKVIGLIDKTDMPVVLHTSFGDSMRLFGAAFLPASAEDAMLFRQFGLKKPRLVKAPEQQKPAAKPKIIDLTERDERHAQDTGTAESRDARDARDYAQSGAEISPEQALGEGYDDYYPLEEYDESHSSRIN